MGQAGKTSDIISVTSGSSATTPAPGLADVRRRQREDRADATFLVEEVPPEDASRYDACATNEYGEIVEVVEKPDGYGTLPGGVVPAENPNDALATRSAPRR